MDVLNYNPLDHLPLWVDDVVILSSVSMYLFVLVLTVGPSRIIWRGRCYEDTCYYRIVLLPHFSAVFLLFTLAVAAMPVDDSDFDYTHVLFALLAFAMWQTTAFIVYYATHPKHS